MKLTEAVWTGWRQRAEAMKKDARKTDTDLAAEISELLGYELGRTTINHWFRNRRDPSVTEFMALCTALGADPAQVLLNVRMAFQKLPAASVAAQALREQAVTPEYLRRKPRRHGAPKKRVKARA